MTKSRTFILAIVALCLAMVTADDSLLRKREFFVVENDNKVESGRKPQQADLWGREDRVKGVKSLMQGIRELKGHKSSKSSKSSKSPKSSKSSVSNTLSLWMPIGDAPLFVRLTCSFFFSPLISSCFY
jgi:hypothetical protein